MNSHALTAAVAAQVAADGWLVSAIALGWPPRVLLAAVVALVITALAVGWVRGEMLARESRRGVRRVDPAEDLFAKD